MHIDLIHSTIKPTDADRACLSKPCCHTTSPTAHTCVVSCRHMCTVVCTRSMETKQGNGGEGNGGEGHRPKPAAVTGKMNRASCARGAVAVHSECMRGDSGRLFCFGLLFLFFCHCYP